MDHIHTVVFTALKNKFHRLTKTWTGIKTILGSALQPWISSSTAAANQQQHL